MNDMKEAHHIESGKIVQASDAEYKKYNGIYQCPID